ncbi:MAG TPA: hypothetical protein VEC99_05490 [Clostridia bacterium]|nr:hypothetical protein [Clostridia bacterium]
MNRVHPPANVLTAEHRSWADYLKGLVSLAVLLVLSLLAMSCGPSGSAPVASSKDSPVATNGTVEVTAKLVEIPEGAIFKRDLYDYATVLKYSVVKVHRGEVKADTIYVGHYDPWKARGEAVDGRVKNVGGNLKRFVAGQTHRLALEVPIEDHFMGGIVNKYFGQATGPIYWAVWTDLENE